MKTITVSDETWLSINTMKYAIGCVTIDDLLNRLILNYQVQQRREEKDESNN